MPFLSRVWIPSFEGRCRSFQRCRSFKGVEGVRSKGVDPFKSILKVSILSRVSCILSRVSILCDPFKDVDDPFQGVDPFEGAVNPFKGADSFKGRARVSILSRVLILLQWCRLALSQ